jgi:hypothetical protein
VPWVQDKDLEGQGDDSERNSHDGQIFTPLGFLKVHFYLRRK